VRNSGRQRETAIRAALVGCSMAGLIRQSLAESALLSAAGGAIGVLLAWWIMDFVVRVAPVEWARLEQTSLDGRVLAFAAALCICYNDPVRTPARVARVAGRARRIDRNQRGFRAEDARLRACATCWSPWRSRWARCCW